MTCVVVVGNPKPGSRTLAAAVSLAERLTGSAPDTVYDLALFGPKLLQWGDPDVSAAVRTVSTSDLVIFASPTYKASYTGLLKLFLDQIPGAGLAGVSVVAMMLGAGPAHAMAPEVFLRPVLVELGANCLLRGLYVLDSEWETSPAIADFVAAAKSLAIRGGLPIGAPSNGLAAL